MTICIAAACEIGQTLVVAADRMFTVGPPLNVEFEPPISKIEPMDDTCVALGAGASLIVADILNRTRERMATQAKRHVGTTAAIVREEYIRSRNDALERQIISPALGPDYETFRSRGMSLPQYLQPNPQIYQQIFLQCNQFNMGSDIIVAGIDEVGSHIFLITHPGLLIPFDKMGYSVTGSGATHAAIKLALELQHPKSSLAETLLSVYGAKLASEVAPGVGKETEMFVVTAKDCWQIPDELMDELKKTLQEEKRTRPKTDEIGAKYANLRQNA